MTPSLIFNLFLLGVILEQLIEFTLLRLNLRHAANSKEVLHPLLANLYDKESSKKSLDYTRTKTRFSIFAGIYNTLFLILIVSSPVLPWLDHWLAEFQLEPKLGGVVYLLTIGLAMSILGIPLSYYSTFVIEENFGFNQSSLKLWMRDNLLGILINFLILGPMLYALLWFMGTSANLWWLYAGLFVITIQIFLAFIYPIWIAPLFNKFSDLEESQLKQEIIKMVGNIGYETTGVFKVDGSKRSSHANAYFTGVGKSKRIVLFDTLIELLSKDQILAVLAHEIGHEKLGHIKKSIALSAVLMLLGFWALGQLTGSQALFSAFGFAHTSNHIALLLFSFISGPILYFSGPLSHILSRKFEYQADRFAVSAIGDSNELAVALTELAKKSLSNLNPHPWYSFVHYSHPTLNERIRAMSA